MNATYDGSDLMISGVLADNNDKGAITHIEVLDGVTSIRPAAC